VPEGALAIARARQNNVEGYAKREAATGEDGKR
jgi:bifunctional N-acetylglucosamine-1-phosphate-uridyltransferase/glucosamine-1-phosphate-acetyltransferase GlmU-like protein